MFDFDEQFNITKVYLLHYWRIYNWKSCLNVLLQKLLGINVFTLVVLILEYSEVIKVLYMYLQMSFYICHQDISRFKIPKLFRIIDCIYMYHFEYIWFSLTNSESQGFVMFWIFEGITFQYLACIFLRNYIWIYCLHLWHKKIAWLQLFNPCSDIRISPGHQEV